MPEKKNPRKLTDLSKKGVTSKQAAEVKGGAKAGYRRPYSRRNPA
jgi:hypothetical protein